MKYRNFDIDDAEPKELLNMSDSVPGVVVDIVKEQSRKVLQKENVEAEEQEALRNTTAGKLQELGEAIKQLGVSTEEACKATQALGRAYNSVPPYHYERRKSVCILGIIKIAIMVLALLSLILFVL